MNLLDNLILDSSERIRDAMQLLDKSARGIVFVTEKRKLIGLATDGDIRRSLLSGLTLDSNIKSAMNAEFIALPVSADDALIRKTFTARLRMIPLCDEYGNLVDVADVQRNHRIPLLEPDLSGRELEYVTHCVETNWISSQGAYVRRFERQFEEMHAGMHALAVSNGTVALHLALYALGIGEGDEVIVPDLTFAATINAVLYCKATPVLCEIDADTLCIDASEAEKLVTTKTRAIVPVHLYGQPCDMDAIQAMAKKHNLLVIEDCAEAIGSRWKDKPVGVFGDTATFSFFGNKTISTGEGGMVLFRNKDVYEHAKILRDHGMTPGKRYWHDNVGFNYRLTSLQAAIGVAQMERFDHIVQKKRWIADQYSIKLEGAKGIQKLPPACINAIHSNWLYTVVLEQDIERDLIMDELLNFGIDSRPIFYPLHEMPPYKELKCSGALYNSTSLSRSGISLPTSVSLLEPEIDYIVESLRKILP